MSKVVLRGHPVISRRYGSICSTCLDNLRRPEQKVQPVTFAARGRRAYVDWKNVEHPEWRKEAVRRLNSKNLEDFDKESYTPDPSTKDGIMSKGHYSAKPSFPPVLLELSPIIDPSQIPEDRRNLDCTRPAPLDAVERKPDDAFYSYYYRLGRSYLKFYKTGFKNLRKNWRELSEIKGWLDPFTIGASARYGGTTHYKKNREGVPIPHISRRDYVLYHRARHDNFKLIPFGLVFLICGEFTPLVIQLLGNRVTPYTCRIPKQQTASIDASIQRFRTFQREMRKLTTKSVPSPKHVFDFQPPSHRREHKWKRDALFGHLVGQTNFVSFPFPLTAGAYWHLLLEPRLVKYYDNIFCDTLLIMRDGGFASLSARDVYEYALNYGSLTLLVYMTHQVKHLKNYDFVTESLKDLLVPILDAEAKVMFDEDFERLHPSMHWMRCYRDSARWGTHTPDVQAALVLMKELGMEWNTTDRESWGGDWKFTGKPGIAVREAKQQVVQEARTQDRVAEIKPELETMEEVEPHSTARPAMQAQANAQAELLDEAEERQEQRKEQKLPL